MAFQRFLFDKSKQNISFMSISHSLYEKDFTSFPHTHSFCEILFVIKGNGSFESRNKSYPLSPKKIIITNPLIPHMEISSPEHPLEYYVICIENFEIISEQMKMGQEDYDESEDFNIISIDSINDVPLNIVNLIWNELSNEKQYSRLIIDGYLNQLIVTILRDYKLVPNFSYNNEKKSNKVSEISYVKEYIERHYASKIDLSELAKKFYVSTHCLINKFKKENGTTPIQYCLEIRVKQAQYLIMQHGLNLTQISNAVGFNSSAYFTKTFKKFTGLTPTEFKENAEKNKSLK